MKKLFIAGLTCIIAITSVLVQAMEPPHKRLNLSLIPANPDKQQGVIENREQLINLMQISRTARNMAYDMIPHQKAPEIANDPEELVRFMHCDKQLCDKIFSKVQEKEEEEEGLFPNIDQQALERVLDLSTQKPAEQLATLMGYSDNQLINIINATNYLDAEKLLNRATREFAINRACSGAHLDQLVTPEGFDQYYEQLDLPAEMDNAIARHIKDHPIGKDLIRRHIQQNTKKPLHTLEGRRNLHAIKLNSQFFVTRNLEKVEIWNINTGKFIRTLDCGGPLDSVISLNGQFVVTQLYNKKRTILKFLDIKTGKSIQTLDLEGVWDFITMSSDGQFMAGNKEGKVEIRNVKTGKFIRTFDCGGPFNSRVISLNGQFMVTVTRLSNRLYNKKRTILKFWDIKTGKSIQALDLEGVWDLIAMNSDSQFMAGYKEGKVEIWYVNTGKSIQALDLDPIFSIAISQDDQFLAASFFDGKVQIWRFIDPAFSSAMRNLALKDAQVIVALMTGKITLATMPEHLREIYDGMPDVLKSLFTQ